MPELERQSGIPVMDVRSLHSRSHRWMQALGSQQAAINLDQRLMGPPAQDVNRAADKRRPRSFFAANEHRVIVFGGLLDAVAERFGRVAESNEVAVNPLTETSP